MKYIKLFENFNYITLYHGSDNKIIIGKFYDNQFFTVNDYIAENYSYNNDGYLYEVKVKLNPFILKEDNNRLDRHKNGFLISGTDTFYIDLFTKLYNDNVVKNYNDNGLGNVSFTSIIEGNYEPLIEYAKNNGYDSLLFKDESFDTHIKDMTYMIFNGNDIIIENVYEIDDDGNKIKRG